MRKEKDKSKYDYAAPLLLLLTFSMITLGIIHSFYVSKDNQKDLDTSCENKCYLEYCSGRYHNVGCDGNGSLAINNCNQYCGEVK